MLHTRSQYLRYTDAVEELIRATPLSAEGIADFRDEISKTELLVPVIGAFSAGKSSLLNAYLGQDILGVGLTPETELATELRYGTDSHMLALRPDGSAERIEIADLESIKQRAGEFTHLQLYLDNPRLKAAAPLVLVDMPGFGSSLVNHNAALAYYLPRGAHYIVVTDVADGNITQSMTRQLDELQAYGHGFTFVLNKVNLHADADVAEVAALIEEQIQFGYASDRSLVRVGRDGQERLTDALTALDSEQIFRDLFLQRLKDLTHTLIGQLNLALSTLKKDGAENNFALHELSNALRRIKAKRDVLVDELRGHQIDNIAEKCIAAAGSALESAQEELVGAALSAKQDAFAQIVSEVVRGSLTRALRNEVGVLQHSVVSKFSETLSQLSIIMGEFQQDANWIEQITERINTGLGKAGQTLGRWNESLAERNNRELARLKKEQKWQEGQPLPRVGYQGLATILAVTTSVVHPLVELAIIFLPNILAFLNEGRQRDQVRRRVLNETIPSIKRELRDKFPSLLHEQLDAVVEQVGASFEHEIAEKQRIIDELSSSLDRDAEALEQRAVRLNKARESLQRLATEELYGVNA